MRSIKYYEDIERKEASARRMFKNHVATWVKNEPTLKIVDWRNKDGSGNCYVRYIFDEENYSLSIHGDLGEATVWNPTNVTFDGIHQFFNNYSYFIEKLRCTSEGPWKYDDETAIDEFISDYFDESFPGNQWPNVEAIDIRLTDSNGIVQYYCKDLGKTLPKPDSDTTLWDVFEQVANQEYWDMSVVDNENACTFTQEEELDDDDNVVTPEMEYSACIVNAETMKEIDPVEEEPIWSAFQSIEDVGRDLAEHFDYRDNGGLVISEELGEWLDQHGYDYWEGLSCYGKLVHPRVIQWLIGLELAKKQLESQDEPVEKPKFGDWMSIEKYGNPAEKGTYITTTSAHNVRENHYYGDGKWSWDDPIAWMPRPEPSYE